MNKSYRKHCGNEQRALIECPVHERIKLIELMEVDKN